MKPIPHSTRSQRGNVLLTTMIFGGIACFMLVSCLALVQTRSAYPTRSLAWNSATPILEAGIEEAFTHLRDDIANLNANGWTSGSGGTYKKRREFSTNGYCLVTISNATTALPVIFSQGFVPAPLGRGTAGSGSGYISRLVQVVATNPVVFTKAIAADGTIAVGNGNVASYNSSTGPYDPSKRRANGGVTTNSKAKPAISVGSSGHIYGHVDTGAGGTVSVGSGSVGDLSWTSSGIEPGYENLGDMNVAYPQQSMPSPWSPLGVASGIVLTTNYTYVLNGSVTGSPVQYEMSALTMNSSQVMIVTGHAVLYVTGNISLVGQSSIYIAPGASLEIYAGGSTTTLGGKGIVNDTGLAANFAYRGLPNNTSLSYSGTSSFIGTINAPNAAFTMAGTSDMFGAAIVKSFNSTGGAGIYYDEALGDFGALALLSYREL